MEGEHFEGSNGRESRELNPKNVERSSDIPRLIAEAAAEVEALGADGVRSADQAAEKFSTDVDIATTRALHDIAQEAAQAAASLEAELAGLGSAERKEAVRETREYRDEEGRWLGTANFEFDPKIEEKGAFLQVDGKPGGFRRLLSCTMHGERSGTKTETDLLALAKAEETEVWIAMAPMANYCSIAEQKIVTAPPLETQVELATLFHELGHAAQAQDDRFKPLKESSYKDRSALESAERVSEALAEVRALFPEAAAAINRIDMSALKELAARGTDAAAAKYALERAANDAAYEKNTILRETILAAFHGGAGLEAFIERMYETPEAELAALLEQAGFEFPAGAAPLPPEEKGPISLEFANIGKEPAPEKETRTVEGLPREAAASHEVVRNLMYALEAVHVEDVDSVDVEAGTIAITICFDIRRETRFLRLHLAPGSERLRAMRGRQAAKQAESEKLWQQAAVADRERMKANVAYEEKMKEGHVYAIANLPRRVLERDATRRAFHWMRTLREKGGVNLFAPVKGLKGVQFQAARDPECLASVQTGLEDPDAADLATSDAQSDLRNALRSYDADAFRLKDAKDPDDIGNMPMPPGSRGKSD